MALIPPFFLDCVVAIGFADEDANIKYVATGFLYGGLRQSPEGSKKRYGVYLITNRHVFQNQKRAFLRFNPSQDKPARAYHLDLKDDGGNQLWSAHPEADVDIVAQPLNAPLLRAEGIQFAYFLNLDDLNQRCIFILENHWHLHKGVCGDSYHR